MKNVSWSKNSGEGTPYCFFYIHFHALKEDWTSFQDAFQPDQLEIMARIQELLSETLPNAGRQSKGS